MHLNLALAPVISLLAGIVVLVAPRLLGPIVGCYLIAIGLIGVLGAGNIHF